MIGLEPLSDFIANIEREMAVNNIRAKEIAMDVSENIFKPIRDSLQKMNTDMEPTNNSEVIDGQGQTNNGDELPVTKFTNSNETDLNRDQILNEIENPVMNRPSLVESNKTEIKPTQEIEIRPTQELETIPGQGVKDIPADIVTAKMTGTTTTNKEIVNVKTESKLPEVTKRSVDPYREPLL
jgi:hypothetical protein